MALTNLLTGTNATTLQGSGQDLVELGVNLVYSMFTFVLDLIINNAEWVVAIMVIGILYYVVRRYWNRLT